jgi:hypothetical protein
MFPIAAAPYQGPDILSAAGFCVAGIPVASLLGNAIQPDSHPHRSPRHTAGSPAPTFEPPGEPVEVEALELDPEAESRELLNVERNFRIKYTWAHLYQQIGTQKLPSNLSLADFANKVDGCSHAHQLAFRSNADECAAEALTVVAPLPPSSSLPARLGAFFLRGQGRLPAPMRLHGSGCRA